MMGRVLPLLLVLLCLAGCMARPEMAPQPEPPQPQTEQQPQQHTEQKPEPEPQPEPEPETKKTEETMIYAHIGDTVLTIAPEDNSSARALTELLAKGDLTVSMHDYGGFEKVGSLGTSLPRNDEPITTAPGDVILYQGNHITIYYAENSWTFTRLGRVQGLTASQLKAALGDGDPTVVFSLK